MMLTDIEIERLSDVIGRWYRSHLDDKGLLRFLRISLFIPASKAEEAYKVLEEQGVLQAMAQKSLEIELGDCANCNASEVIDKTAREMVGKAFKCQDCTDKDAYIGEFATAEVFTPSCLMTYEDAGIALALLESLATGRRIADYMHSGTPFGHWVDKHMDMFSIDGTADEVRVKFEKAKAIFKAMILGRQYIFPENGRPYPGRPTRLTFSAHRELPAGDRRMRAEVLHMFNRIKFDEDVKRGDND